MAKGVIRRPPFAFGPIRKNAYELLAYLLMDFENDKPDENLHHSALCHTLIRLSALVGADDPTTRYSGNPFGDGITFDRQKLSVTLGVWKAQQPGTRQKIPASADNIGSGVSRLFSNREALLMQRLWAVVTGLQSYFKLDPSSLSETTDESARVAESPRGQGVPLPSDIIPWLQEAIRLLDEEHPIWRRRWDFETWVTILTKLDKEFSSDFRPTIKCSIGPSILQPDAGEETRPFSLLRRLASELVPLLKSVGVRLPDSPGSTPDGRLLFWAWHIHNGTIPTLPSWEIDLGKVLDGCGAFSIIKSAIIKSLNPDGSAKLSSTVVIEQTTSPPTQKPEAAGDGGGKAGSRVNESTDIEKRLASLERRTETPKRLTKAEKIRKQRNDFSCKRRTKKSPDTWQQIYDAYNKKFPKDKDASPATLRLSHDRNCQKCRKA